MLYIFKETYLSQILSVYQNIEKGHFNVELTPYKINIIFHKFHLCIRNNKAHGYKKKTTS